MGIALSVESENKSRRIGRTRPSPVRVARKVSPKRSPKRKSPRKVSPKKSPRKSPRKVSPKKSPRKSPRKVSPKKSPRKSPKSPKRVSKRMSNSNRMYNYRETYTQGNKHGHADTANNPPPRQEKPPGAPKHFPSYWKVPDPTSDDEEDDK